MKTLLKALWLSLFITSLAFAHGDEDHGQGTKAAQSQTGTATRIETFTETFELVGSMQNGEVSIFIDRYETNQPVLNGTLEAELNGLKTAAQFRSERGDFVIHDEKFVKTLASPGKHALVFTVASGQDSDLMEATLDVGAATAAADSHTHFPWVKAGFGVLAALVLIALAVKFRRTK